MISLFAQAERRRRVREIKNLADRTPASLRKLLTGEVVRGDDAKQAGVFLTHLRQACTDYTHLDKQDGCKSIHIQADGGEKSMLRFYPRTNSTGKKIVFRGRSTKFLAIRMTILTASGLTYFPSQPYIIKKEARELGMHSRICASLLYNEMVSILNSNTSLRIVFSGHDTAAMSVCYSLYILPLIASSTASPWPLRCRIH